MAEKKFYTREDYDTAKRADIISFLNKTGYELIQNGRDYRSKLHNSLVIHENGSWYWNSKNLGGNSPVELYKQILMEDKGLSEKQAFTSAVNTLANKPFSDIDNRINTADKESNLPPVMKSRPPGTPLKLPEKNDNNNRVTAYLTKSRGIDKYFVDGLIKANKLYESKGTHNCIFVVYDEKNNPQNAFVRGTLSDKPFKKDVELSDKSYAFTLLGNPKSTKVCVFESAVDAISHANLKRDKGLDWREEHRISLGGVSAAGLERFLRGNPQIKEINICLDNDDTGNRRSEKFMKDFCVKYTVSREKPEYKDFNEDLQNTRNKKSLLGNLQEKKDKAESQSPNISRKPLKREEI